MSSLIIQKETLYVYECLNATMFIYTCDSTGGVCMFICVGYQQVISVSLLVMGVPTFSVFDSLTPPASAFCLCHKLTYLSKVLTNCLLETLAQRV